MMPSPARQRFQESTAVQLLAGDQRIGLCGRFPAITEHQHAAPAVVVGIDGPLRFVGQRMHQSRAALIAPGWRHAVETAGGRLAMFVLPSHALSAAGLAPVMDLPVPHDWVELGRLVLHRQLTDFQPVDHLLARAFKRVQMPLRPVDDRLRLALGVLAGNLDENVSIADAAAAARLSPSRLMAIARTDLHSSLRSCRRWLRTFRVARAYADGCSLTDAALAAGFSSSAHLSSAAREHFGIRPSDILTPGNRAGIHPL